MENENTTARKRQRRSTPAKRAEILEEFHRGGFTRIAFCRTHNIALSTLSKWLFNAKRKSKVSAPVLFRELKVPQVPTVSTMGWAVEIVSPDGLVIRSREALSLHDVSWLLRGR